MGIKTNQWNFVNAEHEVIGHVYCRTHGQAFEKLKLKYPELYNFVQIKYAGEIELQTPKEQEGLK